MKPIDRSRLPHFWRGMSFTAKAAWLCTARLARDYSEACAILASMRRPRTVATAKDYWWSR